MKTNSVILLALFTLAGFGAGMIVGGRLASPKTSTTASVPATGTPDADRLPAIKARPRTGPASTGAGVSEPASLAEIEAAIQKAIRRTGNRGYRTLNELMQKVNPSDIPQLLAFAEKLSSPNYKSQLRSLLLSRWAETDASAAMTYADAVPGFQNRQQSILAVLRVWAEKDTDAATAWAQQLPPGPLRKQALGTVSYELAQKNPEAAYALMNSSNPGDQRWNMTYEIFGAWAASSPAAAAA